MNVDVFTAGGQPRVHSWLPNEEGYATTDMESDQLHVHASFIRHGKGLSQGPYVRHLLTLFWGRNLMSGHDFIQTGTIARQFSQEPSLDSFHRNHRSIFPVLFIDRRSLLGHRNLHGVSFILIFQRLVRTEPSDCRMS